MSGIDEMPKGVKKKMKKSSTMDNLLKIMRKVHIHHYFVDVNTVYGTSRCRVSSAWITEVDWDNIRAGDCIMVDENLGEVNLFVRNR